MCPSHPRAKIGRTATSPARGRASTRARSRSWMPRTMWSAWSRSPTCWPGSRSRHPVTGPAPWLRARRIHGKTRGDLAADLMTSPAITVLSGATVAEAAWLAALSRVKRMPVTDRDGRLVGVVRRDALLQSLIRDDAGIRTEVEAAIAGCCPPGDRQNVEVAVHDGIVE
jgi:hypothetical protein